MAEQKSNWLWWTLGGVALLGVGVGTYLYFRGRTTGKQLKNDGKVYIPPVVPPPSTTSTSTSGSISVTVPFKNEMEGNAFRDWVNNNYASWAKENELDRKGKFNNSYIQKAWAKFGVEYSEYLKKVNNPSQNSNVQDLQKVLTAMNGYGIEANSAERVQFLLYDGLGLKNIRVNFTPSGYFWIEMDVHDNTSTSGMQKFDGSWSFANDKFNVKLNDNTFNGTDANLSGMLWALAKKKFPLTLGSMNADGLDDMLNMAGKQYVDSQDSML
jgi:hypothetical protein